MRRGLALLAVGLAVAGAWIADLLRFARQRELYRVPVWIDVGTADPFYRADVALAHELERQGTSVRLVVHGGGHSGWSGRMGEYLRFYAGACRR